MDSRLIVEQRGLYLGEPDAYFESLAKELKRLARMSFITVGTEEELLEKCYTYEPMLIVTELDPRNVGITLNASQVNKYRRSITIGLVYAENDAMRKLADAGAVTDVVAKTGDPRGDALNILRVYKMNMKYGMNLRTLTKQMPVVTDLIWNDYVKDERMLRSTISDKLERLGVRRELAGHKYLIAAIAIQSAAHAAPEPIKLYDNIADYYDTTAGAVEKAIRYAVETAWMIGDIEYQHKIFGMSIDEEKGKPTNAEFIARLAVEFWYNDRKEDHYEKESGYHRP